MRGFHGTLYYSIFIGEQYMMKPKSIAKQLIEINYNPNSIMYTIDCCRLIGITQIQTRFCGRENLGSNK